MTDADGSGGERVSEEFASDSLPGHAITVVPSPTEVPETSFSRSKNAVKVLSGLEWVAVWFAAALLGLIFFITLVLLWHWLLPERRLVAGDLQAGSFDAYRAVTTLVDERTSRFYDLTVTRTLLPVFTTVIGFLLGRRSKED